MIDPRVDAVRFYAEDRWAAHTHLFPHRHKLPFADFHPQLVEDFWSRDELSQGLAFRGSGKSTLGEEDITLAACERGPYHNIVILGSSEARAVERLQVVAYELTNNDMLLSIYGEQKGDVWQQAKIVTAHRVCIQAIGRDQDIRGMKFLDYRPDFVFVDDFEDKDNVQTPEGRAKTLRWFLAEFLPACAPGCKVRIRATPMDAESVPMKLQEAGWPTRVFPIEALDDKGRRKPTWPAAFPLGWIDNRRKLYERVGELATWDREYMCRAISSSERGFDSSRIKIEPRIRSWQAVYAMIDPARTVNSASAMTGWAAWSWIQNRLVVWGGDAHTLLPDQIVALGFDLHERFDLTHLGVEIDGVHQWLLQPFRHEMAKRGIVLPLKGTAAISGTKGAGQTHFIISSLQPFFDAGEVEFAQELPRIREELLNFPRGRRDAINALAYAVLMRPGAPIYDSFAERHIVEDPDHGRAQPLYLAANATAGMTAAALLQFFAGRLVVLADWIIEGNPAEAALTVWTEAAQMADTMRLRPPSRPRAWEDMLKLAVPDEYVTRRAAPVWTIPPQHGERYTNVGLSQAIRMLPAEQRFGGDRVSGQQALENLLKIETHAGPAVEIASRARWTIRALSGGYARSFHKGRLLDYAEEGPYRLLMEGIESFTALMRVGLAEAEEEADMEQNWATDRFGRRYKSALPQQREWR